MGTAASTTSRARFQDFVHFVSNRLKDLGIAYDVPENGNRVQVRGTPLVFIFYTSANHAFVDCRRYGNGSSATIAPVKGRYPSSSPVYRTTRDLDEYGAIHHAVADVFRSTEVIEALRAVKNTMGA